VSKRIFKYFLSVIISVGILWLLLQSVSPQKIGETFLAMNRGLLVWIVAAYAGMLTFRTLRYRVLLGNTISFGRLSGIVNVYNFLNEFLPFRTGELVYLYMIKQAGVPAGRNVSSLIVVRLFDFLTVIILGLSALGILLSQGMNAFGVEKYVWLFPMILIVGVSCFGLFLRYTRAAVGFVLKPFRRVGKLQRFIGRIERFADDIALALRQHMHLSTLFEITVSSLGVWVCATTAYWLIFYSLGVPLTLLQMFFVIAFPALALIVPVQGVAHVGTFEAPVIAGMLAVGVKGHIALAASLSGHIILLSLALLSGLIGLVVMALCSRNKKHGNV